MQGRNDPPEHRLQFYAVIKRNPSGSGFQFSPALSRASSCFFLNNSESSLSGVFTSNRIVCASSRTNSEITCVNTNFVRYVACSCCVRNRRVISTSADGTVTCEIRNPKEPETAWVIDNEIPIFKGEGRKYIDELIFIGGVEI